MHRVLLTVRKRKERQRRKRLKRGKHMKKKYRLRIRLRIKEKKRRNQKLKINSKYNQVLWAFLKNQAKCDRNICSLHKFVLNEDKD